MKMIKLNEGIFLFPQNSVIRKGRKNLDYRGEAQSVSGTRSSRSKRAPPQVPTE